MTTAPIPASLATACAAHDRHRLDVLDALLDEAAPSAVRELLGAALDLCATLRADRDALAAGLGEARATADELNAKITDIARVVFAEGPEPIIAVADIIDQIQEDQARLASERAHLAACQTRIAGLESAANERSAEVARLTAQLEAARKVIDENRAHAEGFARDLAIAIRERDEERATVARLTARVAELEARPVLTVETLAEKLSPHMTWGDGRSTTRTAEKIVAALGPVTLPPAQDRAEELLSAFVAEHGALLDRSINGEAVVGDVRVVAMSRALASLGAPATSPPAAIDADALYARCERDFMGGYSGPLYDAFKHGMWTVCNVLRSIQSTTPPAARPVFAGVGVEELGRVAAQADSDYFAPDDGPADPWPFIAQAVLARLEVSLVAPVDPEAVAIHVINDMATRRSNQASWTGCTIGYQSAVTAAMRATLTAAGVPVTPEVGK